MSSIWGRHFVINIFGESHGPKIGVVINGVPAGTVLDFPRLRAFLDRRRPGGEAWSTPRRETDDFEVISGYYYGHTTGTPLCVLFHNTDMRPADYEDRPNRPGHADYTGYVRYNGFNDPRGGGHFSGRLTAPLVFAGAVAAQILEKKGIYAATHVRRIATWRTHRLIDERARELAESWPPAPAAAGSVQAADMEQRIREAAADRLGGRRRGIRDMRPPGLGSPIFGAAESDLAALIPSKACRSAGDGFASRAAASQRSYVLKDGKISTATNHNGILGGIASGSPVIFEAVVSPRRPCKPQQTVNLKTMEEETITVKGGTARVSSRAQR